MSSEMAWRAASLISSGAAKSGKPWERLTALCLIAKRVISRMTDSVNCSALAESMRRAMCDMLVSAADMGRGYDTRNRTSPKVMGRRKNTEPRVKNPGVRRSGPQGRRETAEAPHIGDHPGPRVRYVRQARLGFGVVR